MTPGTRLGAYEVVSLLGAGGMGEVYRAKDTKLKREVALKVLPVDVAKDRERLARFQREAEVLASLNHPHIAQIYGLEEAGDTFALVMELVEGEDLAQRIARGAIPIDEALPIARQIAEALEAAHDHGIIHRDLKPANIKVRPDGTVKVFDFGLAKAIDPAGSSSVQAMNSPTLSLHATEAGLILGTAAYMAPEQAKGKPVDKRADIWAFGCVLFEMVAGVRPFADGNLSETLASVLKDEPDWRALPTTTPQALRRLLRRCLEKDPSARLRDIGDARIDLNDVLLSGGVAQLSAEPTPTTSRRQRWARTAIGGSILLAGLAAGALGVRTITEPPAPAVVRLSVTPSSHAAVSLSGNTRDVAISPDGKRIAYVGGNGAALFVRDLDRSEPVRISGTGMPSQPFFSPDGSWVGFTDGIHALRRVPSTGGAVEFICRITQPSVAATAGPDGTIVFAQYGSLWRVRAAGGEPEKLASPDVQAGEGPYRNPEFLPGDRVLLFSMSSSTQNDGATAVLDLRTGAKKIVLREGVGARYVSSGHLVYRTGRILRIVPFDVSRLEVRGAPIVLPEPILITPFGGFANFDVSRNGTLLYAPADASFAARSLVWVERDGREEPVALPLRTYTYPAIAPGGMQAALDIRDEETDIWVWDFRRGALRRLTFGPGFNQTALWTPDSRQILYVVNQILTAQQADGSGAPDELVRRPHLSLLNSISPDGTRVVFREDDPQTGHDLMMLTMTDRSVQPLLQTRFNELNGEISPDGRWLAYESDESGTFEIYVRPFPDITAGRWQVSGGGARKPLWSRNGRELFFISSTGAMMTTAIDAATSFSSGGPRRLFEGNYYMGGASSLGRTYDISRDGQRFLMVKPDLRPTSLTVVLNWTEELKRLAPAQ